MRLRCRPGGARSTNGASANASTTRTAATSSSLSTSSRRCGSCTRAAKRTSPPMSASIRCGPPSTTASTNRAAGSTPAASARWASACPMRWASSSRSRDADVFCITGEGSIQMCIQELSTCLQYKTAVKVVSLNNRYLGMVRQWQQLDYGGRYSHSYMDALPDFVKLAEAYGHVGLLVEKPVGRRAGVARSDQAEGPHGVPRRTHRSNRKRLADGAGRQGHLGDAARVRGPVTRLKLGKGALSPQRVRRRADGPNTPRTFIQCSKGVAKGRRLPPTV